MADIGAKFNLRGMISMHQGRERMDVLLTVVLPLFLMLVSSYTNAWAFVGGRLDWFGPDASNTYIALFKGLFIESLVFCFFKLVKVLCSLGRWNYAAALIPFMVGVFGVVVSSGCGVAWAAKSGEMNFLISAVSSYLSPQMSGVFKAGVGMLFPVSLAVLAVYDPKHMIKEHIESGSDLSVLALMVENAEHHQTMLRQAQKEANDDAKIKASYKVMAQTNAQQAVDAAGQGDYSFGLGKSTEQLPQLPAPSQPSVTRISPLPSYPGLPAPQQPYINSPSFAPPSISMGNTTPLNYPAPVPVPVPPPVQGPGFLQKVGGWLGGN